MDPLHNEKRESGPRLYIEQGFLDYESQDKVFLSTFTKYAKKIETSI